MITIVSIPATDFIFCRNKTYITVSTNNFSGQQGFKLICHIQLYIGSAWVTKASLSGYINASNQVKFRIDEAMLPYAKAATLALNSDLSLYGEAFQFKFVEYYEQAEHNAEYANKRGVPLGRNYIHEQDSDTEYLYFTTAYSDKKFLCNRPSHTCIGLNTPVLLFAHINTNDAHHLKMQADFEDETIQVVTDIAINNKDKVWRHYFNLKNEELIPYPGRNYAQIQLRIDNYPANNKILTLHTKTGDVQIRFKSTFTYGWIYNNSGGEDSYLEDWAVGNIIPFLIGHFGTDYDVTYTSIATGTLDITIIATAPGTDSNLWIVSDDTASFTEISNTSGSAPLTDSEKMKIKNLRFSFIQNVTEKIPPFYIDVKPMYNSYQERAYIYKNTLGTYEWMFTHGKAKAKDIITDSDAQLFADNPQDTVVFAPELVNINPEWNTEITANTGHSSAEDFESFKQFMLSAQRYEAIDGKLLPIVLLSKDADGADDNRTIYNRTFKYKYSINDINY